MIFRTASFHDLDAATLYALLKLRVDVFVVEQDCPYPDLDGRDTEPGTRHLWYEVDRKPVAYLHGDTHIFRVDKPLFSAKTGRIFENFTRVETFGWPDSHWVRVTVDPADPQLFRFNPEIVPENSVSRAR